MIAPMSKVYVVARGADRDRLLTALGSLGVVHIEPVDPGRAEPDEQTAADLGALNRAIQILAPVVPAGEAPQLEPVAAAAEILRIQRDNAERRNRLASLHRQIEQLAVWGDVRLEQFRRLRERGVALWFYELPAEDAGLVEAECTHILAERPGRRVLLAAVTRGDEPEVPESAAAVDLPSRDRPALRYEARQLDRKLKQSNERLARLARLSDAMQSARDELDARAEYSAARRSGLSQGALYAVQGWVPADEADALTGGLSGEGVDAAVEEIEPTEEELPPTLIRYPRWARPMKGLFDILGTLPGYRELDLSGFFMIALPLFAGMLIGDAGYGLIFLLIGAAFYRRLAAGGQAEKAHLVLVIGACALGWGVMSANYFGVTPQTLATGGGYVQTVADEVQPDYGALFAAGDGWGLAARAMTAVAVLWRADEQTGLFLLMKIAFIVGGIHMALAHVRRVIALAPDSRALADVGWCVIVVSMLLVVWNMVFADVSQTPPAVVYALLGGLVLTATFGRPHRNPVVRVLGGFAASLLPLINTFGDTISYIRLMAVGIATYFIAFAFNGMAAQLAESATWLAAAPVLIFGHGLNIAMVIIAIFAHGVRLNMLEFSSHAGVEWAGYPYQPFATHQIREH
ncbi:MAG: V-type ATP synthase subunit I [Planctomycetota bacterium]